MDILSLPRLGLVVPPENPIAEPEFGRLVDGDMNVLATRFPVAADFAQRATFELYNEVLPDMLAQFGGMRMDCAVVACNASHYLLNPDGDRDFCQQLSEQAGYPVLSSTQATLIACQHLGVSNLTLVSPYAPWLTELSQAFWEQAGIAVDQVLTVGEQHQFNPYVVTTGTLLDRVRRARLADDAVVLFAGTGVSTLPAVVELARAQPAHTLLTANLAAAWWARRAVGLSAGPAHPLIARIQRQADPESAEASPVAAPVTAPTGAAQRQLGGEGPPLVALVSGGASGIGAAAAQALSTAGVRVAALDLNPDQVAAPAIGIACDVTDDDSVRHAVAAAAELFGGIDIVVNNAGIAAHGDVAGSDDEQWRRVLDVNVVGMARLARAALPHLRRSDAPAIVNTCSVFSWVGVPQRVVYSASKGAVYALTLAMAADHATEGIRVNAVAPGAVDTPWITRMLADTPDPTAARAALDARHPIRRLVQPREVGDAITYLATPASSGTTGTVLVVDGGLHTLR